MLTGDKKRNRLETLALLKMIVTREVLLMLRGWSVEETYSVQTPIDIP
jgi:hypothetical protein